MPLTTGSGSSAPSIGATIGGVAGGALLLCGLVIFVVRKKRKRQPAKPPAAGNSSSPGVLPTHADVAANSKEPATDAYREIRPGMFKLVSPTAAGVAPAPVAAVDRQASSSPEEPNNDQVATRSTTVSTSGAESSQEDGTPAVIDALHFVVNSAQAIAERSSLPLVPEIAAFLGVLANLFKDFADNKQNMPKTIR